MLMLSPDLLDRRALALIELVDYAGRAITAPARIEAEGLRLFAKGSGRYAVLEASGFESYAAAFVPTPAAPAVGSKALDIGIIIASPHHMARRAELKLPRNADPAMRGQGDSLFAPVRIGLLPSTGAPIPATAAAVRFTVVHKSSKKRVGNALVRVQSDNGKFAGSAVTNSAGEALVIIPCFPISFTTGAAAIEDSLAAKATVVADPQAVVLTDVEDMASGGPQASLPFTDPEKLAARFAVPANGTAIRLSTRRTETVTLEWSPP